jgi:hypothetical protein
MLDDADAMASLGSNQPIGICLLDAETIMAEAKKVHDSGEQPPAVLGLACTTVASIDSTDEAWPCCVCQDDYHSVESLAAVAVIEGGNNVISGPICVHCWKKGPEVVGKSLKEDLGLSTAQ